jgi:DNA repair protein RadD
MIQLRPYQGAALRAVMSYFRQYTGNPIVAMPTGTGKSVVIAGLIEHALTYPDQHVLMITHRKELIEQNAKALQRLLPDVEIGIMSAGLRRYECKQVTFAGVATLANREVPRADLIVIDECHLVNDEEDTMYSRIIASARRNNPAVKVVGFSATPYRLRYGLLTDGELWDQVAYDLTKKKHFDELIKSGYLAPLVAKAPRNDVDLHGIHTRCGDYQPEELSKAMDRVLSSAADEICLQGQERKRWLIFCASIANVEHMRNYLQARGIDCEAVHSRMPTAERDETIERFKAGGLRAIVNAGILTTGFDCPEIDLIAVLRPTQSPGLWVQMLGRGTRPAPDKTDCMVLDYGRNTMRMGPIDMIVPPRRAHKTGDPPPMKMCPDCYLLLHASVRICPCGHEFPQAVNLTKHSAEYRGTQTERWATVDSVQYRIHDKGDRRSLNVLYHCGFAVFREWICIGYPGFAGRKADQWIAERTPFKVDNADDAVRLCNTFKVPKKIFVSTAGKFAEVKAYEF